MRQTTHWPVPHNEGLAIYCNDFNCAGNNEFIVSIDTNGVVGRYSSIFLSSLGSPAISYYNDSDGDLKVLYCGSPNCIDTYITPAQAQSIDIGAALNAPIAITDIVRSARLDKIDSLPAGTSIIYQMAADGSSWETVVPGVCYDFINTGSDLRWQINLSTSDALSTPYVDEITVEFYFGAGCP